MKPFARLGFIGLIIGIIVWCISLIFFNSHPGKVLELKGLDYLFYLRGSIQPPKDIVIVAIDESSFSELNLSWPWPRGIHGRLIDALSAADAKVIGFDVLFADPTTQEEDSLLAQAIESAGDVVLPSDINITEEYGYKQIAEIEPMPLFKKAAKGIGSCNVIFDKDNVVRKARLKFGRIKSFAYEILRIYGTNLSSLVTELNKDILINFIGPPRSIKTVSYYQALNYKDCLPDGIFKDKIVLTGRSLSASPQPQAREPDVFSTPRFPGHNAQMSGIEIIANFIDTVMRNRYIKEPPRHYIYLALLIIFIAISAFEIRTGYIMGLSSTILFTVLYGGVSYLCFAYNNVLLPVFAPTAGIWLVFGACSLTKYFIVAQEEKYIKTAFQKYVPPSVVKRILESKEQLKLGGSEITGTVLFSDLERFTTISEKFTPEKLVSFINEYLTEMSDIIFKYGGTITRFIGDAILAIWGAPVRHEDHAEKAVLAALEMTHRLKELNIVWKLRELPELKVRIGINTGPMVVGNVGSKQHMDYTAMGDSVNVAARLEEANRSYGTNIIIGHYTYELVNKIIECRKVDTITVRGREEQGEIYEPIGKISK